ncbi:hypothetical protein [Sorangium sp. So ce1335]|uniref:hypothetical protein n=1 Tax=Sorangium sp. So ce1335 TaxID=3133335 RepID=UPI003F5E595A
MGPLRDGWTRADVEAVIARGEPAELLHVPLVVSLDPPGRVWAEQICLRLAAHPSPNVRGNALLGLGHLARIFRSLHRRRAQPVIEAGLQDPDPYVRGQAGAAADDVAWYLGWVLAGREHDRGRPVCPR